jgi:urease accessory protein
MGWHATLDLNYRRTETHKTVLDFAHNGPLRVLQSLYPEGDAVCHNVLVHPPGGIVGGDVLDVTVNVQEHAHALITTPGATRFYKTTGAPALQRTRIQLAEGARLEWLPLENIAYSGCDASNELHIELAPTAMMMGWDITALGLQAADQPFVRGLFTQSIHAPGVWLERGRIDANDDKLLSSALGLNGQRCLATIFLIAGSAHSIWARDQFLSQSREISASHPLSHSAGTTSPHAQLVVMRALADHTEIAMDLCRKVWAAWRTQAFDRSAQLPRIWSM